MGFNLIVHPSFHSCLLTVLRSHHHTRHTHHTHHTGVLPSFSRFDSVEERRYKRSQTTRIQPILTLTLTQVYLISIILTIQCLTMPRHLLGLTFRHLNRQETILQP